LSTPQKPLFGARHPAPEGKGRHRNLEVPRYFGGIKMIGVSMRGKIHSSILKETSAKLA
jgi:hypothetical protein